MKLRIVHFADLHLGVESGGRPNPGTGLNQRIHDVCDRLDELCAVVEAEEIHVVLFAGDAFKNQHPSTTLASLFAKRIRRMARAGASVFLLVGNHDLPKMAGLAHPFSIYDALEIEGVVVGERADVYHLPLPPSAPAPELQVAALPHFSRHQVMARIEGESDPDAFIAERLAETVAGLAQRIDPALPAVFTGHCHVHQAKLGGSHTLFGVSDLEVPLSTLTSGGAFPYYALGHIHRRQVLIEDPFVVYPGSLERVDYGEGERIEVSADGKLTTTDAEPKGFYRFDLEQRDQEWKLAADPQFREVDARTFCTIRLGRLDTKDPAGDLVTRLRSVVDGGADLDGAFVKVEAGADEQSRRLVSKATVAELIPNAYDVVLALQVDERIPQVRDPRFAERMPEHEALDRYLETRDDWASDRAELTKLGRALIDEVLS